MDDNPTSREILIHILHSFNFRVDEADSGAKAIEKLENADRDDAYELILMDWRMPGMDGIEATRKIKQDKNITHTPTIIMISAFGRMEMKKAAKGMDFESLLAKPITPSALQDAILTATGHGDLRVRRVAYTPDETVKAIKTLQGKKLLLVEDNEINQELAVEILTSEGIEVDTADDGAEALLLLDENYYDGVLMDCQMPVMDGYEATRIIRTHAKFDDLPIIAMTANAMGLDRQKALAVGMNDYISKPVNVNMMFVTIAKWVTARTESGNDAAAGNPAVEPTGTDDRESVDAPPVALEDRQFPGIDIQKGLEVAANRPELYRRLLLKFPDNQARFEADFETAISAGDLEGAAKVAHALKGVSANLGMIDLRAAAEGLEMACRNNADDIDEKFITVKDSLEIVLGGLADL